jgi:protein TonB
MDDVLREVANPPAPNDLATRTTQRSFTMSATTTPASNLLIFGTLDRTAGRRMSPQSITVAALLNIAALLLLMMQVRTAHILSKRVEMVALVDSMVPPPLPPAHKAMGGGGGHPDNAPVSKGNPPKSAPEQLNPPKMKVDEPKLAMDATVDAPKMTDNKLPNFGMPNSPNIGSSLGNGRGTGVGSGEGAGVGVGIGGGTGGGLKRIGGGVHAPEVLFAPEPQFSDEARKAKVSGNVLVYLEVDATGKPMHVRVLRGIGMGLDEKALEAVRQYRFKPAMENGKPVAVPMNVEVNFNIY